MLQYSTILTTSHYSNFSQITALKSILSLYILHMHSNSLYFTTEPPRLCTQLPSIRSQTSRHVGDCALRIRHLSSLHTPCMLLSVTVPSRQPQHLFASLPESVQASASLPVFWSRLKTEQYTTFVHHHQHRHQITRIRYRLRHIIIDGGSLIH